MTLRCMLGGTVCLWALGAAPTARTLAHETWGFGFPRSGHLQAIVEALRAGDAHNDPRRYLESRIGPDPGALDERIGACINAIDRAIADYADDPIASPAGPLTEFFVWARDDLDGQWLRAQRTDPVAGTAPIPRAVCVDEP
jgi:hypothetical protein